MGLTKICMSNARSTVITASNPGLISPLKGSVETFTTQLDLLRKSCHSLSAHHIADRFLGAGRISRRERVIKLRGNHLLVVPILAA
jgi:hypothetical protein